MRSYAVSATVVNGSPDVTCTGAALLANAYEGDSLLLPNGTSWPIKSVNSNTSLTLEGNFVGTGGTFAAFVTRRNDAWVSTAQLHLKYSQILETLLRGYTLTSPTSLAIGTGSKAFTTQGDAPVLVGVRYRAASRANPTTHWMEGVVTAYAGGVMTLDVDVVAGSGSRADWNLNIAGARGATGGTWGAADTPQMAGIELGHATDTTLTRAAAGQLQVEGSRVFQRNNILGAVAQSGGVPTGAIIETGSNANGAYVRFASGLQICQYEFIGAPTVATLWVRSTPAEFYDSPTIVGAENQYVDVTRRFNFSFGSAGSEVYLYSATADDLDYPVRCVAMGRWF